jgi:hypothetical protein
VSHFSVEWRECGVAECVVYSISRVPSTCLAAEQVKTISEPVRAVAFLVDQFSRILCQLHIQRMVFAGKDRPRMDELKEPTK